MSALRPDPINSAGGTTVISEQEWIEEIDRRLTESGLIEKAPLPIGDKTPYLHRRTVKLEGQPLSQMLVDERR